MWWPLSVVVFYVLSVVATLIARRTMQNSLSGTTPCFEFSIFITMGFVISSFALPIVLARVGTVNIKLDISVFIHYMHFNSFQIAWGACYLTLSGNFIVYLTIVGYFMFFENEDNVYGGMA